MHNQTRPRARPFENFVFMFINRIVTFFSWVFDDGETNTESIFALLVNFMGFLQSIIVLILIVEACSSLQIAVGRRFTFTLVFRLLSDFFFNLVGLIIIITVLISNPGTPHFLLPNTVNNLRTYTSPARPPGTAVHGCQHFLMTS